MEKLKLIRNNRWFCILLFCSMVAVMFPGRMAGAATKTIQKEVEYVTQKKEEKREKDFPETIKQDGVTYIRKNVAYQTLEETPKLEMKDVQMEIESDVMKAEQEYTPEKTIEKDGIRYVLKSTSQKKKTLEKGYIQTVTGYSQYETLQDANNAPARKQIQAKDKKTGEMVTVSCEKQSTVKKSADTWEDSYIDILFSGYDANHFVWNGVVVEKNTKNPLKGYEKKLIQSVGVSEKNYRIRKIQWNGKAYKNKNGVLCRKARANVQKRVPHYRVTYAGTRKVKKVNGVVYKSIYTGKQQIDTGATNYKILATATYEKESTVPVVAITIAILFGIIIIVGIIFILAKKKSRKAEKA